MNSVNRLVLIIAASFSFAAVAQQEFSADMAFGSEMPAIGEIQSLKQAIAANITDANGMLKIEGQITEVCQAKGCWMILVDGDSYARVTFEDYAFFVPMATSMQRSVVYGTLTEHVLSGEQAEHYAQDAGAESILKLSGEVKEYSIVARSVQLENRS
ncbi:MAG: hypothetical protein ACJA2Q_002498 [Pseudohongiellaceae bacterium]|jgi:hypothetical protein